MFWKIIAILSFVGVLIIGFWIVDNSSMASVGNDKISILSNRLDYLQSAFFENEIVRAGLHYRVAKLELELDMSNRTGKYLVIDRHSGHFWVRDGNAVLYDGMCGVGKGNRFVLGREYDFETPAGKMKVLRKIKDPWWHRPNWFWYEKGMKVPKKFIQYPRGVSFERAISFYNSLSREDRLRVRAVPGSLGKYAIQIANGIYIHYNAHRRGRVSHGCIRVSRNTAKKLYYLLKVGDPVYVF
ncbi:L,D-transpeptidase [bacterium]|nr:L,D-transpeptidase [bacterium]